MGGKITTAITTVKRDVQLRKWSEQIKAQQESGMTVTAYCAQNGINIKTYYYHLRKVRNRQIFHVPHKEKTLADFGEGFSIFSFKFQYFINITNHILVLYLSLFQTYGFQKSNKCTGLFILI